MLACTRTLHLANVLLFDAWIYDQNTLHAYLYTTVASRDTHSLSSNGISWCVAIFDIDEPRVPTRMALVLMMPNVCLFIFCFSLLKTICLHKWFMGAQAVFSQVVFHHSKCLFIKTGNFIDFSMGLMGVCVAFLTSSIKKPIKLRRCLFWFY